ncbi:hypothetical protein CEXT_602191 [Caerostris extrusa]|uniref:Uncharacterized protein n=1 Tax=Caerostris extrusa TaxID=172846 RepID=A0AAV4MT25_CAEEX|nr:hypothetical protein CEXT_602191 [Caerostris extrusa]
MIFLCLCIVIALDKACKICALKQARNIKILTPNQTIREGNTKIFYNFHIIPTSMNESQQRTKIQFWDNKPFSFGLTTSSLQISLPYQEGRGQLKGEKS